MESLDIVVRESLDARTYNHEHQWEVLIGSGSYNNPVGQVPLPKEVAEEVAAFLREKLIPYHEELERAKEKRRAEWDRERRQKDEEQRPAREKAARERLERLESAPEEVACECEECGHVGGREEFEEPLYECSCGTGRGADERRCDQCHRFRAKVADESCPECEQACNPREVLAKQIDGEWIKTGEWDA